MSDRAHGRSHASIWPLLLAAAAILMITMGARQSLGLFVSPLNTATGLGIVSISFAMAVAQFIWGASQPIFGAIADRYGSTRVLIAGGLMMAAGFALTPLVRAVDAAAHRRLPAGGWRGSGQLRDPDRRDREAASGQHFRPACTCSTSLCLSG